MGSIGRGDSDKAEAATHRSMPSAFLGGKDDEVVRRPGDAHLRAGREGNVGFGARQLGDEPAAAFELTVTRTVGPR